MCAAWLLDVNLIRLILCGQACRQVVGSSCMCLQLCRNSSAALRLHTLPGPRTTKCYDAWLCLQPLVQQTLLRNRKCSAVFQVTFSFVFLFLCNMCQFCSSGQV